MPAVTFPTDPTRLDYTSTPWVDGDGNSWLWVAAKTRWESVAVSGGVTDHGALTGRDDDDHTQYALADGSRGTFATAAQGTDERVPDRARTG